MGWMPLDQLPRDFPPWGTVWDYFRACRKDGTWTRIHDKLSEIVRVKARKNPQPSAAIMESQSVKMTVQGGSREYDTHKKVNGRKRHLLVDTLGLILLVVVVHRADVQGKDGARLLFSLPIGRIFSRLQLIWADGGYAWQASD